MRRLGLEPSVELGQVRAPAEAAARLGLEEGDPVSSGGGACTPTAKPMQLATSYVPWALAEGTQMVQTDTGPGGIYSRLADVGHRPVRFVEEVATRMASVDEARFLDSPHPSRSSTS